MPQNADTRAKRERIKQREQAQDRQPGTNKRAAASKKVIQRTNEPLTKGGEKPPVRSPPKVNKAPVPREQPTKKKAEAKRKASERMEREGTPKAHNIR